jgi:hypothetical protein
MESVWSEKSDMFYISGAREPPLQTTILRYSENTTKKNINGQKTA